MFARMVCPSCSDVLQGTDETPSRRRVAVPGYESPPPPAATPTGPPPTISGAYRFTRPDTPPPRDERTVPPLPTPRPPSTAHLPRARPWPEASRRHHESTRRDAREPQTLPRTRRRPRPDRNAALASPSSPTDTAVPAGGSRIARKSFIGLIDLDRCTRWRHRSIVTATGQRKGRHTDHHHEQRSDSEGRLRFAVALVTARRERRGGRRRLPSVHGGCLLGRWSVPRSVNRAPRPEAETHDQDATARASRVRSGPVAAPDPISVRRVADPSKDASSADCSTSPMRRRRPLPAVPRTEAIRTGGRRSHC